MNATVPVACDAIVERCHDARRSDKVGVVETGMTEVSANHEVTKFGKRLDLDGSRLALVVA